MTFPKDYDFKSVDLSVGGRAIDGFAQSDTDAMTVELADEYADTFVGADGEVVRAKTNNQTGTLRVKLHAGSLSNDHLSGLAAAGTKFDVQLVHRGGTTLVNAVGWVKKKPDLSFGSGVSEREWVISLANVTAYVGGVV